MNNFLTASLSNFSETLTDLKCPGLMAPDPQPSKKSLGKLNTKKMWCHQNMNDTNQIVQFEIN